MPEVIDKSNKGHVASEAALDHVKVKVLKSDQG
jgi:hypothetical protein